MVVGIHLTGGFGRGRGVEVGGDPDAQLLGMPGALARGPVDVDRPPGVRERPADIAEDHGEAEAAGPFGALG